MPTHLTVDDIDSTISKQLTNVVFVNSISDLPSPVSGIITLAANTIYRIASTTIALGANQIKITSTSAIIGQSAITSILVYSGVSDMFIITDSHFSLSHVTCVGNSIFNATDTLNTSSIFVESCLFQASLGTITGFDVVKISSTKMDGCANGLTVSNTKSFLYFDNYWTSANSGTYINIPSGTFDNIIISRNYFDVPSGTTGLNIDYATIVLIEFISITSNILEGAGTLYTGFTYYDLLVDSWTNKGIADSKPLAGMSWSSQIGTMSVSGTNVWTKITGNTSTAGVLRRFTHTSPNKLTYTGTKPVTVMVTGAIAAYYVTGGAFIAELCIFKNGVQVASGVNGFTIYGADEPCFTASSMTLNNGDYVELYIKDTTGGSGNFVISFFNVQIS